MKYPNENQVPGSNNLREAKRAWKEKGERKKKLYDLCDYSESIFYPLQPRHHSLVCPRFTILRRPFHRWLLKRMTIYEKNEMVFHDRVEIVIKKAADGKTRSH